MMEKFCTCVSSTHLLNAASKTKELNFIFDLMLLTHPAPSYRNALFLKTLLHLNEWMKEWTNVTIKPWTQLTQSNENILVQYSKGVFVIWAYLCLCVCVCVCVWFWIREWVFILDWIKSYRFFSRPRSSLHWSYFGARKLNSHLLLWNWLNYGVMQVEKINMFY